MTRHCTTHADLLAPVRRLMMLLLALLALMTGCGGGNGCNPLLPDTCTTQDQGSIDFTQLPPQPMVVALGSNFSASLRAVLHRPQDADSRSSNWSARLVDGDGAAVGTVSPASVSELTLRNGVDFTFSIALPTDAGQSPVGPIYLKLEEQRGPQSLSALQTLELQIVAALTGAGFSLDVSAGQMLESARGTTIARRVDIVRQTGFRESVTLSLEAPPGIHASFSPNPSDDNSATLSLTVDAGVPVDTYTITLKGHASRGEAATTRNFSVRAGGGTTAQWVSLGDPGASAGRETRLIGLAAGMSAAPVIAYRSANTAGRTVLSLRTYTGTSWTDLLLGADSAGPPATMLIDDERVAVTGSGRVLLARIENETLGKQLRVYLWSAGNGWQSLGSSVNVRPGRGSFINSLDLQLDSAGQPVLAFGESAAGSSGGTYSAYVRRWNGSDWQTLPDTGSSDGAVSAPGENVNQTVLTLGSDDQPHVVYGVYAGARALWYRHHDGAAGWSAPLRVNPAGADGVFPALALDAAGQAVAAWVHTQPGSNRLRLSRIDSVAGSVTPVVDTSLGRDYLNAAADGTGFSAALRRDASGRLILAWSEASSSSSSSLAHVYARRQDGAAWPLLGTRVDADSQGSAINPQISFDATGEPLLGWTQSTDASDATRLVGVSHWAP